MPILSEVEALIEDGKKYVQGKLQRASRYLRDTSGRTETEGSRRILTEASKIVGTDAPGVDLTKRNIAVRVKV